ncbi:MAG TPA: hypothetical protein DCO86_01520 [Spirochaetaceae bacterium]|nr:hypothetical protein [Spirochaetaceae bacterium]
MKKMITAYILSTFIISMACILAIMIIKGRGERKLTVKVLILPKFEVGEMAGDFPGEAQFYYEGFLEGGKEYDILNGDDTLKLYFKDGVALCTIGTSKVNSALNTSRVLSDPRFDFSQAYIISTGCAGSAAGSTVMGDVFVITDAADYDLGHHADPREMTSGRTENWFHDPMYDGIASIRLNKELAQKVFSLVKDIKLETTQRTQSFMKAAFPGESWAMRDPKVLKGSTITGDNYWKGKYGHDNALLITETYGFDDPYALTEMEDAAIGQAIRKHGMLDRFIILRDSVNIDAFMMGETPESLWCSSSQNTVVSDSGTESADIFTTAMENNFKVGKVIIEAILSGKL